MLENINAVLFDLDGTLVDSMWMWKAVDEEFLAMKGLEVPENLEEFQQELEGMGFTETAAYFKERFALPDSLETIKSTWVTMAEHKYCHEIPLKKGAREFLGYLKERKIPAAICSSNSIELIRMVLKAHSIEEYFTDITTCCDVPAGKPAPDVYLKTAAGLHKKPEECLVFEDVPMGILAGKNAGMKVCAVEDAFSAQQADKKKDLADYYIDDYFQVMNHTYEVLL